jgi:hypothetical protein
VGGAGGQTASNLKEENVDWYREVVQ